MRVHKQDTKRTSIIVPTYNRENYLASSLGAIIAQTDERDEVIVVNDGSTDRTRNVLAKYGARVHVINQSNSGKSAALNAALARASGQYVWIVDDDDIVCPTALKDLLELFRCSPSAAIAYGRHSRFRENPAGRITLLGAGYWDSRPAEELFLSTLEDFYVHQPGMLVRRELYRLAGPFDETLPRSVDYEMLIRLAYRGKAVSTDKVIFHQRLHDGDRGPASARLQEKDRNAHWVANDASIFRSLHASLPLAAYLQSREILTPRDRRRAFFQRGVIMARKKQWSIAMTDFDLGLSACSDSFTAEEERILRRATGSKYGCDELFERNDAGMGLRTLRDRQPQGLDLSICLARGLLWRVRAAVGRGELVKGAMYLAIIGRWMAHGRNLHRARPETRVWT